MPLKSPRRLARKHFHRHCRAEPPFAAHRDAVERSQDQKDGEVRRERRRQFEDRKERDVDHQRRASSEAVGKPAEITAPSGRHMRVSVIANATSGIRFVEIRRDARDDERQQERSRTRRASSPERRDERLACCRAKLRQHGLIYALDLGDAVGAGCPTARTTAMPNRKARRTGWATARAYCSADTVSRTSRSARSARVSR